MRRTIFMVILLIAAAVAGKAQTSQALYFMNIPQASTLNPALKPTGKVYLGLPGISDISVRVDNNFLSVSGLFTGGIISDSTLAFLEESEWLEDFVNGLGDYNSLEPQAGVKLFGLAFTVKDDLRITFDITERADANIVFPGDLLRLGLQGNEGFVGQSLDFSSLRSDASIWHEFGIGASKNVTSKLRVGARLLVLSGVASAYLDNRGVTLKVNDDYTHTVNADMALNISAPVNFITEDDGSIHGAEFDNARFDDNRNIIKYLTTMANPGFGIDLGAEYRFNDRFAVSAAVTDLGFIKWSRDRQDITVNTTFDFNGLTMQDVYDESLDFGELLNWTLDTLQNAAVLDKTAPAYTYSLPATVTAAFSYTPVKFFTAGLLSRTRFEGRQAHQALTLSGNFNFGNVFSTTLAYTAANRRYDNLGFGFAIRGGFTQFFALVDNVPVRFTSVTHDGKNYRIPENWSTVHARFGLNLVFGNKQKEKIPPLM
ncbi:MAG: DUF5723 family protein [Bacteroidales bacterium]|jgi:hypothetical protein|nr:DUF5723 family protein [Bacteroidales bacterium]